HGSEILHHQPCKRRTPAYAERADSPFRKTDRRLLLRETPKSFAGTPVKLDARAARRTCSHVQLDLGRAPAFGKLLDLPHRQVAHEGDFSNRYSSSSRR